MSEHLDAMVSTVSAEEPFFLGFRLRQSAEPHGWTDANLARQRRKSKGRRLIVS
jgi:hypothetical protein